MTTPRWAPAQWAEVERLFDEALMRPPARRIAFLDAATEDPSVREEVASLLRSAQASGDFLKQSPALRAAIPDVPQPTLALGVRIGAWRVDGLLGRGGMAEVYRVQRADGAYEQRAALKLLHVLATAVSDRFHAERQILARLEHPGIARLLDGGMMPDGRPFMVVEYVAGQPITTWCSARGCGLQQRLRLMLAVCEAVAYAHRNLVVHRDLKPGNIFVTDGGGVKLLDFGIAKLLRPDASGERTMQAPMTPDYAAPEQVSGAAITTATDVYALGVLLHELLVGRPPWRLTGVPLAVAVERLLHDTPALPSAAAGPDSPVPARALRGDLDAIVTKCLRKAPEARYATVQALNRDMQRHLAGEPVGARAGNRVYVAGRVIRRWRWPLSGGVALVLALVAGLAGTAWQARQAGIERDLAQREAARTEAVRQFVTHMFRVAQDGAGSGPISAKQVLDRSAARVVEVWEQDPDTAARLMHTVGELYLYLNDYESAGPLLERFLEGAAPGTDPEVLARARFDLAQVYLRRGEVQRAQEILLPALAFWSARPDRYREELMGSRLVQSQIERGTGRIEDGVDTLEQLVAARRSAHGPLHRELAVAYNNLAVAYSDAGRYDQAAAALRQAWAQWEALGEADTVDALNTLNNLGGIAARVGDNEEAAVHFGRALDLRRALYAPSAATAALLSNYAKILLRLERAEEALPLADEGAQMAGVYAGAGSPLAIAATVTLAEAQQALGQIERATVTARDAVAMADPHIGTPQPAALAAFIAYGRILAAQGRQLEARAMATQAQDLLLALGDAGAPYAPLLAALQEQLDEIGDQ